MRTTVTLDADVATMLQKLMRERGLSFKEALNQVLRRALSQPPGGEPDAYVLPTFRMGFRPEIALDKALALAAAEEDAEIARKLSLRK